MQENLLGRKADIEKSRARVQDLERRLCENRFTYFFLFQRYELCKTERGRTRSCPGYIETTQNVYGWRNPSLRWELDSFYTFARIIGHPVIRTGGHSLCPQRKSRHSFDDKLLLWRKDDAVTNFSRCDERQFQYERDCIGSDKHGVDRNDEASNVNIGKVQHHLNDAQWCEIHPGYDTEGDRYSVLGGQHRQEPECSHFVLSGTVVGSARQDDAGTVDCFGKEANRDSREVDETGKRERTNGLGCDVYDKPSGYYTDEPRCCCFTIP